MSDQSTYSKKIQQYLANELSDDELKDFEKEIKSNPDLQEEIKLYRKVEYAVSDDRLANFKDKLDLIHTAHYPSKSPVYKLNTKKWYLAAAVILMLITIGSVFIFNTPDKDPASIFDTYYQAPDINITRSADHLSLYDIAANAYVLKDYRKAFTKFKKVIASNHKNIAAKLYCGISALELKKYDFAKEQFMSILNTKDTFYIQDAQWYLAMVYLKTSQIDNAISTFIHIKTAKGVYAEKASSILDLLQ